MNLIRSLFVPLALAASAAAVAPSAMAGNHVDWSVSIGTPGYYGPPPVVYAPPPPVIYAPPRPVVVVPPAPRTVYPMVGPGVVYTNPGYMYNYDYGYVRRGPPPRHWHRPPHWHR
ncbi:MAG: hypothetical protein WBG17_03790 [Burkholderiaceae bacterium]